MSAWRLCFEGFDPASEGLREALCTLGNGYFATRGAAPECQADAVHYPGSYLAGCYDRLVTHIGGQALENESLVNIPNWLPLALRTDGQAWLRPGTTVLLAYRQELHLGQALLTRVLRLCDSQGRRLRLTERRLVSMARPHLAALAWRVEAENWQGPLALRSALDGGVSNSGVARYRRLDGQHLEPLRSESEGDTLLLASRTLQSGVLIALAARTRLWLDERALPGPAHSECRPGWAAQHFLLNLAPGQVLQVEKVAAIHHSRDRAISEPLLAARQAATEGARFAELHRRHRQSWSWLWRQFRIDLRHRDRDEQTRTARTLRTHILHLLQTVSPHVMDLDAGVPARGLHGEAYRGHVFWDELFVFPLFNLRMPEITRALLCYRHRRLDAARRAAHEAGYRGAMYPWQSGSDGREESQRLHLNPRSGSWLPDHSHLQRHINAAVAYNLWHYFQVTGDEAFLASRGAEMLLEIARFWASAAQPARCGDRYEIHGVVGPDEYHDRYPDAAAPGLSNNSYTNLMAVWVLQRALELEAVLPPRAHAELCERLELGRQELQHWDHVSRRMRLVFHADGLLSQFEGFDALREFDWAHYRRRYGDIQRLDRILEAEGDSPNRYKICKQADVLMLYYLFSAEELAGLYARLGYNFDPGSIPRTLDYYLQRTAHGSTLSRVVHAWVLTRANRPGGWPLFRQALGSDLRDIQGGTTAEGIHLGAMAGTVDLVQRGLTGIEVRDGVLWLNPCLPEGVRALDFALRYRGLRLRLRFSPRQVRIRVERAGGAGLRLALAGRLYTLWPGQSRVLPT